MEKQVSSFFEPTEGTECCNSTAGNYISLTNRHLSQYQDPLTDNDDVLLPEEHLVLEEECFVLAEEYVLFEGEYIMLWEKDYTPHRIRKPGKGIRNSFKDEVLSVPTEESNYYLAESIKL